MENRNCPLMDGESISENLCYECCMISERYFKADRLPEKIKENPNFREICINCEHHDLD